MELKKPTTAAISLQHEGQHFRMVTNKESIQQQLIFYNAKLPRAAIHISLVYFSVYYFLRIYRRETDLLFFSWVFCNFIHYQVDFFYTSCMVGFLSFFS